MSGSRHIRHTVILWLRGPGTEARRSQRTGLVERFGHTVRTYMYARTVCPNPSTSLAHCERFAFVLGPRSLRQQCGERGATRTWRVEETGTSNQTQGGPRLRAQWGWWLQARGLQADIACLEVTVEVRVMHPAPFCCSVALPKSPGDCSLPGALGTSPATDLPRRRGEVRTHRNFCDRGSCATEGPSQQGNQ